MLLHGNVWQIALCHYLYLYSRPCTHYYLQLARSSAVVQYLQRVHAHFGVEDLELDEARVDDVLNAVHRQARFGNVGGHHALAYSRASRLEDLGLGEEGVGRGTYGCAGRWLCTLNTLCDSDFYVGKEKPGGKT